MNVKILSSWNLNIEPLYSTDIPDKIKKCNDILKIKKEIDEHNKDELLIQCVQGAYGYRSGIIGNILNILCENISEFHKPMLISTFMNNDDIKSNDYEIISYYLTLATRWIPFLNLTVIDPKNSFSENMFDYSYGNGFFNKSMSNIIDLKSLFLLEPLYDSGCAIYSNKPAFRDGFEKWNISDETTYNRGILWSYYKHNNEKGVLILNFEVDKNYNNFVIESQ